MRKEYDVFIAYHGSYEGSGTRNAADHIFSYLSERGFKCFYFPYSGKDAYKSNILDVMKSRALVLVCSKDIHVTEIGRIDPHYHYELSTEIDAFYALSQIGEVAVKDAKVFVVGDCRRGFEGKLHELFANRTHIYENYDPDPYQSLENWLTGEISRASSWQDTQITSEIKEVFAVRASMKEACNFDTLIAMATKVRAIGISNSEMTVRANPDAIAACINNGGEIELIFLDPKGEHTSQRETEEKLRPGKIRNITMVNIDDAFDMKYSRGDKGSNYHIMIYDQLPRMNMIFADDYLFLQYYANNVPGLKNPSFFIEKQKNSPIFSFCDDVYKYLKSTAREIEDYEVL